tara:strand:- start:87690 stop:89618 length:1929 start_codon:yes stop_codon:yes gene_type:complete
MSVEAHKETHGFQTEVKQILDLMIHSLYSNKEIFLRELISNSSDALDKLRFLAVSDKSYKQDGELSIHVDFDKEAKAIIIEDNGVGMSRDDVVANLGTIAKSGTKEFLSSLTGNKSQDTKLIGQFGVGFYAVFMVADSVTVETRRANLKADEAVHWVSTGDGKYTIENTTKDTVGTKITLHMKEGEDEFLEGWRLRSIITKYSDHISFPVIMKKEVAPANDADKEADKAKDIVDVPEEETVNKATALWLRAKSELTQEEYDEFYKYLSHDYENPLTYAHNKVEGKLEYTSLLYVPKKAPFDMWQRDHKYGLKLYVQRVFIMDDVAQFLPNYFRFVKGIVDCNDLPLNVSREILQKSKSVDGIKGALTKRIFSMIESMATKKKEDYAIFWKQFGNVLKEGPAEDFANKERVAKLLRFSSTHTDSETQDVSLDDYINRMKDDQEKIYYVTAETFAAAKNSPYLEKLREKGLEIILLYDRVDEWLMSNLNEYSGKQFQSVSKGDLDLGKLEDEKDKEKHQEQVTECKELVEKIQKYLEDKVKEVRVSSRLKTSPACIVVSADDMALQMQRMMSAAGQQMPASKPIFEINPDHLIISKLKAESDDNKFNDWVDVLFDQSILAESGQLDDPARFVEKLNKLMLQLSQ